MRTGTICATLALLGLGGCAHSPISPSIKLAAAPKLCVAVPVIPPTLHKGDDLAVDDAKVHAILGGEEDGKRACQSYIRRLRQGA